MQNNKNFVLFLVLTFGLMVGWMWLSGVIWPPPPKKQPDDTKAAQADKEPPRDKKPPVEPPRPEAPRAADVGLQGAQWVAVALVREVLPQRPRQQVILGAPTDNLRVLLDSRGAGVVSVTLNKFQQADSLGRPVWLDRERGIPRPLELVMAELNQETPSHVLYHFDLSRRGHDPLPDLGQRNWDVIPDEEQDGVLRRVSFTIDTVEGVRITKTFSLQPGDYHIGLEVRLERSDKADPEKPLPFRYQLTSAHGLRIEGDWYSSVLRNALIGWHETKRDTFARVLEDARRINFRQGGDPVEVQEGDKRIRYAGVAVQFFASMLVVDDRDQPNQSFLNRARPTLEGAATKGRIKSIAEDQRHFDLVADDGSEIKFQLAPGVFLPLDLEKGSRVAVVWTVDEFDQRLVQEFRSERQTEPLFFNDISVRVATEPLELKPGDEPIVHRYLLYNGPFKVRLLGQLTGDKAVDPELVTRYEKTLHLNSLADYPSPGLGEFFSKFYWTELLIACTNLMHWILGLLHSIIPSHGLCIVLLTVLVRGAMFPISRKQALTSIRMQELAPELKKLQEKYKNDRQALGMAQMELYRKHGVNPLGTCWLLFLQMPVFLGLYYCLQESILFRLAPFLWIRNLSAPDMLIWWTEQIPIISEPANYSAGFWSFLYLGPYFNLLPVIAVALMIVQQQMMTPPAMDEQQAAQMKMMKYMMVVFGLMFYKVAAGLCIYFIASSAWGFAERKLLPKKKLAPGTTPASDESGGILQRLRARLANLRPAAAPAAAPAGADTNGPSTSPRSEAVTSAAPAQGKRGKRRKGRGGRGEAGPAPTQASTAEDGVGGKLRSWWAGLREWWAEVRRQAEKK
jgi:YidC/Oxa1 family membrane protein insertase